MTYEYVIQKQSNLKSEQKELIQKLGTYPTGQLLSCKNVDHFRYFISDGHTRKALKKKTDKDLIGQLAQKRFLQARLDDIEQELVALQSYLKNASPTPEFHVQSLAKNKAFTSVFQEASKSDLSAFQTQWVNEPYEANPAYPEALNVPTIKNFNVRSKSEAIIVMCLEKYGILYKYEAPLNLEGHIVYPDFTVLHPIKKKELYWEHLGMMDSEDYVNHFTYKTQLYSQNGIIPGINLIQTSETASCPLDVRFVCKQIEAFLCI